ncbi:MAG TPA: hypothetical protein VG075_04400 [Candidatus Acidoferrum sp.]|jgi:hypothetical protein|nr:hypothetical protein [Candidatus Acidoferrum sp.]
MTNPRKIMTQRQLSQQLIAWAKNLTEAKKKEVRDELMKWAATGSKR